MNISSLLAACVMNAPILRDIDMHAIGKTLNRRECVINVAFSSQ